MEPATHDELNPTTSEIRITAELRGIIATSSKRDVVSLFQSFRLNLQSRIVAVSDDRELHKLQGKLEYVTELEKFFLKLLKSS